MKTVPDMFLHGGESWKVFLNCPIHNVAVYARLGPPRGLEADAVDPLQETLLVCEAAHQVGYETRISDGSCAIMVRKVDPRLRDIAFFGASGQGCQMEKFDPFLSLDCARVEGVGAQFCHLATLL